jgi:hypothetical protein
MPKITWEAARAKYGPQRGPTVGEILAGEAPDPDDLEGVSGMTGSTGQPRPTTPSSSATAAIRR